MKPKQILFISLFLILASAGSAQLPVPKKCYLHLRGTIDTDIRVTIDLVKAGDSLYGDHTYAMGSADQKAYNIYYGASTPLAGKVNPDGSFFLGTPFSESGPVFRGTFGNGQVLKGTWENGKDKKKLAFELRDSYTDGAIPFTVFTLKDSKPLVKAKGSPEASIALTLLLPSESSNPLISDSLKSLILTKYSNRPVSSSNPDAVLAGIRDGYFNDYISDNQSIYKELGGASFAWELLRHMHIQYNSSGLLTFYLVSYAFTGGAHGLESHDYFSVDLKSGRLLRLQDMLKPGYEKELTTLLTGKLKEMSGLPSTGRLTEAGYFTEEVKPNENFYVMGNGIGFFYNHYELAPYSNGFTDIFLTNAELKAVLK
jgi:hypothetical protein